MGQIRLLPDLFACEVTAWWTSLGPEFWVAPDFGSVLSLFRGGEQGMMPWDVDIDCRLLTSWRGNFDEILAQHPTAHAEFERRGLSVQARPTRENRGTGLRWKAAETCARHHFVANDSWNECILE